jgi:hypothetical protein
MNQPLAQSKTAPPPSHPQALAAPHTASAGTARPTHAEIAKRAYEIYLKKGRKPGQCERNWLQAEQELRNHGVAASQSKPSGDKPAVTHSYSSGAR